MPNIDYKYLLLGQILCPEVSLGQEQKNDVWVSPRFALKVLFPLGKERRSEEGYSLRRTKERGRGIFSVI